MENLRVLEGSEVFFRGLQLPDRRFKSVSRLCKDLEDFFGIFFCLKITLHLDCVENGSQIF